MKIIFGYSLNQQFDNLLTVYIVCQGKKQTSALSVEASLMGGFATCLLYNIVNLSFSFRLLIRQNKHHEDITLVSENM